MTSNGESVTVSSCYYCAGPFDTTGTTASTFSMACSSAMNTKWTAGDVASCGSGG